MLKCEHQSAAAENAAQLDGWLPEANDMVTLRGVLFMHGLKWPATADSATNWASSAIGYVAAMRQTWCKPANLMCRAYCVKKMYVQISN
jgi:hypothetical protein